jgi:hypothetical protein
MARINTSKLGKIEPKNATAQNEIHRYVSKHSILKMPNVHIHELTPNVIQYKTYKTSKS